MSLRETPVIRATGRLLASAILIGALATVAAAYTLVLRDGRRVEIPSQFTLSKTTLTYEAGQGINITLLLTVVDIAATEHANQEASGGFFKHALPIQTAALPTQSRRAQLTVTNQDLEASRRTRVESERAYEQRRIELGLPSVEESRRHQALREEETLRLVRARERERAGTEAYWRDRAGILRGEIVATDAEINYLRTRLDAFPQFPLATHSLVTSVLPLAPRSTRSAFVGPPISPGVFATGPQLRGRVVFGGGAVRGQVLINPSPFRSVRGFGYGGFPIYEMGGPFSFVEGSYERTGLIERLNSLLVARAGLSARWRELEDEARDERVPQVWLEP